MNVCLIALHVLVVIFLSTVLRAVFGFGNALIAMPLLVILIGVKNAAALMALVGTLIAVVMLFREWEKIKIKDTFLLLLFSLIGIPIGLMFLKTAPENTIKIILGLVLVGFGLFNLFGWQLPRVKAGLLVFPFGIIAGMLGGAYNANGPPVVLYGVMRGWDRDTFRTSLQGYFLVTNIAILIGHGLSGLWNREVFVLLGLSVPAAVLAVFLGSKVIRFFPEEKFQKTLYLFIVFMGSLMFL
jgi:uncharacterized membrane protein YfcA